ncbi:MAG: DUF134 domain-containing protein [Clostridia bacterium]|nr:DUF134 domain-containing protein [Clostridia bacterium]
MPRPQRCRRICSEPEYVYFGPQDSEGTGEVVISFDEYEVIRLVDHEGRTHEQCAAQMDISRTTVTEIYESARRKLADVVVNGKRMLISGGNYRLCGGTAGESCGRKCIMARDEIIPIEKGENTMRIAVTYDNGNIFQHFGHTEQFKLYDVQDGKIVNSEVIDTNGSGHGALAVFLIANGVDALICGGIGGGAQMALAQAGIKLYGGVSGSADEAANAFVAGELGYNPNVKCDHHDHEHGEGHDCGSHGEGHTCGDHGCGGGCGNH